MFWPIKTFIDKPILFKCYCFFVRCRGVVGDVNQKAGGIWNVGTYTKHITQVEVHENILESVSILNINTE